jgi:hypothetical protein
MPPLATHASEKESVFLLQPAEHKYQEINIFDYSTGDRV